MKKIISLLVLAVISMSAATSCEKVTTGLYVMPIALYLSPGQYGAIEMSYSSDIPRSSIRTFYGDSQIAQLTENMSYVEAIGSGVTKVGIYVLNDPDDESKGFKYSAFCTVTVY